MVYPRTIVDQLVANNLNTLWVPQNVKDGRFGNWLANARDWDVGKGVLRCVEQVFDCCFESGSTPYASAHYPFENKESFLKNFPGDLVSEAIDQTRGWFYTLHILSTHLFGTAPWNVTGLVLAADGKKMSKSLRNYPDLHIDFDQYGADATRMFLVTRALFPSTPDRRPELVDGCVEPSSGGLQTAGV
ncbi:tRNA synthetases class I-domain-containing protein [Suillus placidus]|uniref:tRNA synthetases class I-domain-containing protein n=1 Tax=Suillus placidus TaxID=48579 RepID=A0A9P7CVZ5_9AGAM|nr:tRNA synthetases class I-domain-containing protein [Suillus placidus]